MATQLTIIMSHHINRELTKRIKCSYLIQSNNSKLDFRFHIYSLIKQHQHNKQKSRNINEICLSNYKLPIPKDIIFTKVKNLRKLKTTPTLTHNTHPLSHITKSQNQQFNQTLIRRALTLSSSKF